MPLPEMWSRSRSNRPADRRHQPRPAAIVLQIEVTGRTVVASIAIAIAALQRIVRIGVDVILTSDAVPIAPSRAPPDDPTSELDFGA